MRDWIKARGLGCGKVLGEANASASAAQVLSRTKRAIPAHRLVSTKRWIFKQAIVPFNNSVAWALGNIY